MGPDAPDAQLDVHLDPTDPRYVFVAGRRLARVMGGDGTGDDGGEGEDGSGQDTGQGGIGDLYDLESAPAELRPYLEEQLKGVAGKFGRKLEEHATYRKQWEPLEKIEGLRDMPPDEIEELLTFRNLFSAAMQGGEEEKKQFAEWWDEIGEHLELFDDGEETGEEEGLEGGEEPPPWAKGLMERLDSLEGEIKPVRESISKGEQERRQSEAAAKVADDFKAIDPEGKLTEEAKEEIAAFAVAFYGDKEDAVAQGFKRYQQLTGRAQGDLADSQLDAPDPAKPNGQAVTSPEEFSSLDDPRLKAAVKARLAGAGAG